MAGLFYGRGAFTRWFALFLLPLRASADATIGDDVNVQRGVVDTVLPCSVEGFRSILHNFQFQQAVFDEGKSLDTVQSPWIIAGSATSGTVIEVSASSGPATSAATVVAAARTLNFRHPVKSRFPGLPSHAITEKKQDYTYDAAGGSLVMRETTQFANIPYGDYFTVHTIWTATDAGNGSSRLVIDLYVAFSKPTWLRGKIERDTASEAGQALRDWVALALTWLAQLPEQAAVAAEAAPDTVGMPFEDAVSVTGAAVTAAEEIVTLSAEAVVEATAPALEALAAEDAAAPSGVTLLASLSPGEAMGAGEYLVSCEAVQDGRPMSCASPPAYLSVSSANDGSSGLVSLVRGPLPPSPGGELLWSASGRCRPSLGGTLRRLLGAVAERAFRRQRKNLTLKGEELDSASSVSCQLRLRDDGVLELVAVGGKSRTLWRSTRTGHGFGRYRASVTRDGRLAVSLGQHVVWQTGGTAAAAAAA